MALPAALRADRAAVDLNEVPDDREAEAQAVVRARRRAVRLTESVEDEREELDRDALAVVADLDLYE